MPQRPLEGLRVLITRERAASEAWARELEQLGAQAVVCPALAIQYRNPPGLDEALSHLERFDWLILTSANAVGAIAERFAALGLDPGSALSRIAVGVVGHKTATALAELGGPAEIIAQPANAANLAARLEAAGVAGKLVLFPASRIARPELSRRLRMAGAGVVQLSVYDTVAPPGLTVPGPHAIDAALFTSPSAVEHVAAVVDNGWFAATPIVCIGPTTTRAAREAGATRVIVAGEASLEGILAALTQFNRQPEQEKVRGYGAS